ncbi:GNAT family N-acetyltransferase [Arthrobacter sp. H5]|uniref:GNAT family N-acetyltransferase n=1 Tax=Arthrobacter sp. H5 TaxID=1267973 RepID=UPI00048041B5|nr:GNAT family N-acetyltransferase [Arthrobacter sp. H5]
MTTMSITIERLELPESLDSAGAADFIAASNLGNLVERQLWGHDDFFHSVRERFEAARPNQFEDRVTFVARHGGRVIGKAVIDVPLTDNLGTCYVTVLVHPDFRRQGLGGRLHAAVEEVTRRLGRTTMMSWSDQPANGVPNGPGVLVPATGAGGYPGSSASAILALHSGYSLAQIDRASRLMLAEALPSVPAMHDAAMAVAGPDYRMVDWLDDCPPSLVDQYARLRQAMSTDVPMGDLVWEEEVWDADRVRESEQRIRRSGGRRLIRAVLHLPSGILVGHTILDYQPNKPEVVSQEDTLVITAHRGHRLGMWLKAANLLALNTVWPAAQRVYTWNAEENAHMLAVNVELGFKAVGYTAAWQKKLEG